MGANKPKDLLSRLRGGEPVVVAEGYLFEFERRGYLRAGCFVPEVVLEHPDLVTQMHRDFVHAGSDVVLAFTYYGHRAKLELIDRDNELEELQRKALRIARQVADETGTLMAGNICNTNIYKKNCEETREKIDQIFKEQIEWAVEEGADFLVAETFFMVEEAFLAIDAIKKYGRGLPMVVTLAPESTFEEDMNYGAKCAELEKRGAHVVGLNCVRGPKTMVPLLEDIRKRCKVPIAALPVPYRTNPVFPTFLSIRDMETGSRAFPADLDAHLCSRSEVAWFASECSRLGVTYVGVCCGASPAMIRTVAETLGRRPPASKYSPDMTQHFAFGSQSNQKLEHYYLEQMAKKS